MNAAASSAAWRALREELWVGGTMVFAWSLPFRRSEWYAPDAFPDALPDNGSDWYFGVHPVAAIPATNSRGEARSPRSVRSQTPYIAAVNALYGDYDAKIYGDKAGALAAVRVSTPPPSVIIDSGGGYHAYWLLSECVKLDAPDQRERMQQLQRRWAEHCGADPGAKDLCRVLRVPGTLNHKYSPPRPVTFERVLNVRYTAEQLEARLPALPQLRPYRGVARAPGVARVPVVPVHEPWSDQPPVPWTCTPNV